MGRNRARFDQLSVVAYTSDGDGRSVDRSFSEDGKLTDRYVVSESGLSVYIGSTAGQLSVQSDGKIVASGTEYATRDENENWVFLSGAARYLSNGTPDTSYGTMGKVTLSLEYEASALDASNRLLIAGTESAHWNAFALERLTDAGAHDSTFAAGAPRVYTSFSGYNRAEPADLAIHTDGSIVVVGDVRDEVGNPDPRKSKIALVRYSANGSLDTGFADQGKIVTYSYGHGDAVAVQADGQIVVLARLDNTGPVLLRINNWGFFDGSFGNNGVVTLPDNEFHELAIQPDNKIVLVGARNETHECYLCPDQEVALARYNPNGTLDSGFGSGGVVYTRLGVNIAAYGNSVAFQPDGRILVAGVAWGATTATISRFCDTCPPDYRIRALVTLNTDDSMRAG